MNDSHSTVTIIGCGYVGLTTAAILSNCGVKVYALEVNPKRLDIIKQGRSFFYEAGLDALIKNGLDSGTFLPTDSYTEAVAKSQIIFSCVGTPDNADGSSNLSYVFEAAETAAALVQPGTVYAQKSTVPVGTGEKVETIFAKAGKKISYVSNPEFLREGTAISDSLWFDRIVTGSNAPAAAKQVAGLYKMIEQNQNELAKIAGIAAPKRPPKPEYFATALSSAELIKVSANAFLALKISFANSIAKLADQAGADVDEVMNGVGADRRIGRAFLNAGRGYGGGCFPKDVSGLIRSAEEYGVELEVMHAATAVNSSMPHYIINKAERALDSDSFEGKNIAVLGLAFKAGTSDVRRSPAIVIANTLAQKGAHIKAYDPEATEEAKEDDLDSSVELCRSLGDAIKAADIIVIATDWPEFKSFDFTTTKATLIIDAMNCLRSITITKLGKKYIGIGKS